METRDWFYYWSIYRQKRRESRSLLGELRSPSLICAQSIDLFIHSIDYRIGQLYLEVEVATGFPVLDLGEWSPYDSQGAAC